MKYCYKCGAEWTERAKPGFNETCEVCQAWWRACRNCRHYNPKVSDHCEEPKTDPPRDPEGKNFCEQFAFVDRDAPPGDDTPEDDAKDRFDSLFG